MVVDNSSFDTQAAYWWDENGPFKMLHRINPLRLAFLTSYVADLNKKRLLDVGCGGGIFSESLASKGAKVVGLDTSCASIEVAKMHAAQHGVSVDYKAHSLAELAKKTSKFDKKDPQENSVQIPY